MTRARKPRKPSRLPGLPDFFEDEQGTKSGQILGAIRRAGIKALDESPERIRAKAALFDSDVPSQTGPAIQIPRMKKKRGEPIPHGFPRRPPRRKVL